MVAVKKYDSRGQEAGTAQLPEEIFGAEPNQHLLYLAVKEYLDNQRQGTANTKDMAEIRGGGKKPFAQKHTGRARQGSRRSSIHVGGYVAHGPHPRDYSWELPRKQRRAALISALSDACRHQRLAIVDRPQTSGKTKELAAFVSALGLSGKKVLFLDAAATAEMRRAGRNIPGLSLKPAREVNPYDLLWTDQVLLTESGLEKIKEALKP